MNTVRLTYRYAGRSRDIGRQQFSNGFGHKVGFNREFFTAYGIVYMMH